jgi:hypothetical protein
VRVFNFYPKLQPMTNMVKIPHTLMGGKHMRKTHFTLKKNPHGVIQMGLAENQVYIRLRSNGLDIKKDLIKLCNYFIFRPSD